MPDVDPCELVRGVVVHASLASPEHGIIEGNFAHELNCHVLPRRLGKVLLGEVGIYTEKDPDTVRAADAVFISNERLARVKDRRKFLEVPPELIVEVISPKDGWRKVRKKVVEYLACGVQLVWVADPRARTIHAYRPGKDVKVFHEGDDLPGDEVLPGFSVPVARIFAD
jgi:Uma2 family endonuclease